MYQQVQFETPENIRVSYQPAGLGSRFVAWMIDQFLVYTLLFVIFVSFMCTGIATAEVFEGWTELQRDAERGEPTRIILYFIAMFFLVWGFGSFVYFAGSEFFWNGQTIGKARMKLRVVKTTGFALDSVSILIRNIFRVIDHMAVLWIVPLVNSKSQRLGDLVAGTVVVSEQIEDKMGLRETLSEVSAAEATFRFPANKLKTLSRRHLEAVERLVERWGSLKEEQRKVLGTQVISIICAHFNIDSPAEGQQFIFLKDLLSAEYRSQHRELG